MVSYKLINDFHGTEVWVRPQTVGRGDGGTVIPLGGLMLSARTVQRVERVLCGHADCQCGGLGKIRGKQPYQLEERVNAFGRSVGARIVGNPDG